MSHFLLNSFSFILRKGNTKNTRIECKKKKIEILGKITSKIPVLIKKKQILRF